MPLSDSKAGNAQLQPRRPRPWKRMTDLVPLFFFSYSASAIGMRHEVSRAPLRHCRPGQVGGRSQREVAVQHTLPHEARGGAVLPHGIVCRKLVRPQESLFRLLVSAYGRSVVAASSRPDAVRLTWPISLTLNVWTEGALSWLKQIHLVAVSRAKRPRGGRRGSIFWGLEGATCQGWGRQHEKRPCLRCLAQRSLLSRNLSSHGVFSYEHRARIGHIEVVLQLEGKATFGETVSQESSQRTERIPRAGRKCDGAWLLPAPLLCFQEPRRTSAFHSGAPFSFKEGEGRGHRRVRQASLAFGNEARKWREAARHHGSCQVRLRLSTRAMPATHIHSPRPDAVRRHDKRGVRRRGLGVLLKLILKGGGRPHVLVDAPGQVCDDGVGVEKPQPAALGNVWRVEVLPHGKRLERGTCKATRSVLRAAKGQCRRPNGDAKAVLR